MPVEIEVCIDNLESLHNAIQGGADRIELCSSLALGGLTPSYGFMKQAALISSIPVYAMIRPRQGDFIFDSDDIECMLEDIHSAGKAKLQGVVLGALTPDGEVDENVMRKLVEAANQHGLGITFHRAIDQCNDYQSALESIISLGCERVLTSGLAPTAEQGIATLKSIVKQANQRIDIMAGAGVNADNALAILRDSGVHSLHLSGKTTRPSKMLMKADAKMGNDDIDDYVVPITDTKKLKQLRLLLVNNGLKQ
ncbi:copper homeostasis protein CutC [Vibrio sp. T187]|uniref:copper homeostasis protein CutC n=1 Tax=Vibrio TaxID=662 RepID=UPI0010CA1705|nr:MULTISPECIES: copper homeostasis protein CutC [Vibrio]MBW3697910.1 copper homeostasis protein CutC [Vibrio sp. T187]